MRHRRQHSERREREQPVWVEVEVEVEMVLTWMLSKNNLLNFSPKQRHAYFQPVVISEFTAGHVQINVSMNKPKHPPTAHLRYCNQKVLVNKHIIACFPCVINSLWACICCMWATAAQEVKRSSSNQKVVIRSPAPAVCMLNVQLVYKCVCDLCCKVLQAVRINAVNLPFPPLRSSSLLLRCVQAFFFSKGQSILAAKLTAAIAVTSSKSSGMHN